MNANDDRVARHFAIRVVKQLRNSSFTAYFAGGCVRDQLLGRIPKDYDVATNARPEQVREVFGRRRTVAVGASFGVITVLGPTPAAGQVEVATFRRDGEYSDGRHPDGVTFSTPEEDAHRRDFTINGMFFDPISDQVIDFVDGQVDLSAKRIRAIGDPLERIAEDKLRMLRAIRFAATYEFALDEPTLAAIQRQHATLSTVSQERITHELQRMLVHPHRRRAIELLMESKLFKIVFPELEPLCIPASAERQATLALVQLLQDPDFALVLAALFGPTSVDFGKQQMTQVCRHLKVSNEVRKDATWIIEHQRAIANAEELAFSQLQPLLVQSPIRKTMQFVEAIACMNSTKITGVVRCRRELEKSPEELNPAPLIRGEDLAGLGIVAGPSFSRVLGSVRDAQLDGLLKSKQEAITLAKKELGIR